MADRSAIEWTDATWNPVRGAPRSRQGAPTATRRPSRSASVACPAIRTSRASISSSDPERLDQPLRWRQPRMIFVNSMSDLFHEDDSCEYIARCSSVMTARRLAHVPDAHEAARAAGRARRGFVTAERLDGREHREPALCTSRLSADRASGRPLHLQPSRCSVRWTDSI